MRVTSYVAPIVEGGAFATGVFTPGKASFEVGIVDLDKQVVLCKTKGKAQNSKTIEATTTWTTSGNTLTDVSTNNPGYRDLADNIEKVAFAELAKLSPVFALPTKTTAR
jgi:hypothetical protein